MNDSGGDVAAAVGGQLRAVATHLELVLDERVPAHDLVERDAARALIYAARDAAAALEAVAIPDRRDLPAGDGMREAVEVVRDARDDPECPEHVWAGLTFARLLLESRLAAHPAQPLPAADECYCCHHDDPERCAGDEAGVVARVEALDAVVARAREVCEPTTVVAVRMVVEHVRDALATGTATQGGGQ